MYINIKVFDLTGNEKGIVEVPDDLPVNRLITLDIPQNLREPKTKLRLVYFRLFL